MKLMRAIVCAVILGAFSIPAVAAPAKAKKPTPTKVKKVRKSKKARKGKTRLAAKGKKARQRIKNYEFLGDNLEGNLVSPDGDVIGARGGVSFSNLIKFRRSFLPEITKAGEDL